jgi:T5orf172 domain
VRLWIGLPRILGLRTGIILGKEDLLEKPARRPGQQGSFVYVIRGDHRLAKIGVTTNPTARLAALRTASGFPLSLAFAGATASPNSAFAIERESHRVLDRHRVEGEWFDIPVELAIATVWAAAASLGERLSDGESGAGIDYQPPVRPLWLRVLMWMIIGLMAAMLFLIGFAGAVFFAAGFGLVK